MFGLFLKPKWSLSFWNASTQERYVLESDSIGELLGYIATDLENGLRPSAKWVVLFVHRSARRLRVEHEWPCSENPVVEIVSASLELDGKLTKAKRPPNFFGFEGNKKVPLPLYASVGGISLISMSLEERIILAQSGLDDQATTGIFDVVKMAFTETFGVPSTLAGQLVYSKLD